MFLILFKFVVFFFYFKRCFIAKFQNLKPTRNIVNILNNAATPRGHCFKILLFSKTFAKKTVLLFKTKILQAMMQLWRITSKSRNFDQNDQTYFL